MDPLDSVHVLVDEGDEAQVVVVGLGVIELHVGSPETNGLVGEVDNLLGGNDVHV